MNKKLLAVAIAGALSAPSAFAATDTSGMQFTSASEGFYASIRVRFNSAQGGHEDAGSDLENGSSRIGVRGSNDLGGGLEGYYQWELGVNTENGASAGSTRIGHVGLRGGWGDLMVGSGWTAHYNMTHGSTDIANTHSGNLNYTAKLPGRASKLIQYTSPNLSGFQGAIAVQMGNTRTDAVASVPIVNSSGNVVAGPTAAAMKDGNDLDMYLISAQYEVQGFSAAIGYSNIIEGQTKGAGAAAKDEDATTLVYKLGYGQDNWYVNGWYSSDNSGDVTANDGNDLENLSLAGGVSVGKVNLYAVYEAQERDAAVDPGTAEDEYTTVGVQYNLGARSRVWVEYAGRDLDENAKVGDFINIGLRHDF